ncbi:protein FAM83G-like isoform X2 [Corythoichthys intestinalis]|uniref:protein FAM83G-like isoform X2 n=1 Tax=Corythoichthys intestinalis TaxID=161448 RepID=UPI0025A662F3|nr:protein FAM83G-like isoform X2 [Corythoichthys intestinalis]
MALSQIQCLDDNHVNPRINESKPDFLYSEDQRLALEVLLREGRESFVKFLEDRQMRSFLSDLEQETLTKAMEPYDPGLELFPEDAEENEPPLSSHYWPELSDMSIPQLDLGWPHIDAYRGVTRTTVYTQPPLEGQTHIKEIVRKMIAQAQKVIAVVMDVFTDVDIFRDLIDAGFRKKVSVYILVESTSLPHFLSMCQRANMHPGHLKNLRVRCTAGTEFYTRSCTMVKGRLGHRFMFIDGDKALSGSFSFTWMSSRLDKNLVTVVTGQAVEAFDHLFRHLYMTSRFVDLQQVTTEPEPEREAPVQLAPVVLPSSTIRKLYNPKYALLIGDGASTTTAADQESPKESQTPEAPDTKKRRRGRASKEPVQEEDSMHPGLMNLEKAYLIPYLPTWPEPDPPSDVIGFINIVDASKPTQVHLQRSERFETSQAIRFRNPLTMSDEPMPEVEKPRETTSKIEEKLNVPQSPDLHKVKETVYDRIQSSANVEKPESHSGASRFATNADNSRNTKQSLHSVELTSPNKSQGTKHLSLLFSNIEQNQNSSKIDHLDEQTNRAAPKIGTSLSAVTGASYLPDPAHSNSGKELADTKTTPLVNQANNTQPYSTSEISSVTHTLDTSRPTSSSSSSSKTYTMEPHTNHQATKDSNNSNGLGTPTVSTSNTETTEKHTGENKQQTVSKMKKNSNGKTKTQKDDSKSDAFPKNQQHTQKETSAVRKNEKAVGRKDDNGRIAVAPLATNRDCLNIEQNISDDIKTVSPVHCDRSVKPQEDQLVATGEAETKATSKPLTNPKPKEILNETESEKKTYHVKENKPQKISYGQSSPLTMWERIQAGMDEPSKDAALQEPSDNTTNLTKKKIRSVSLEYPLSPKQQSPPHTPRKAQHLNTPDTHLPPRRRSSSTSRHIYDGKPTPDSPAHNTNFRTPSPKQQPPPHTPRKAQHLNTPDTHLQPRRRSSSTSRYIYDGKPSPDSPAHNANFQTPSPKQQSPPHIPSKAQHLNTPDTRLPPRRRSSSTGRHISDGKPTPDSPAHTADFRTPSATNSLFTDYSAYVALFDNKDKNTSSKETRSSGKKVKMRDKEDVKSIDSGIKKTSNKDSKEKSGRNDVESKQKTFENEKETQSRTLMKKSRTQGAAGPSSGDKTDGSAREVADQKLPNATATPSRPVSAL